MKEIKNDNFKDVNKLEFKCTCKHCGCQFEYSDSDICDIETGAYHSGHIDKYGNMLGRSTRIYNKKVKCPNCGTYCEHKKYLNSLDENKRAIGKFGIIASSIMSILTLIIAFSILIVNFTKVTNTESSPKYELTCSRCDYTWVEYGGPYWTPDGGLYTGDDLSYAPEGTYIVYKCDKCGKDGRYIIK